ncbi:EamA family transporter RarD [Camelliibacillus cellulosilyticus]|uniref:EamA family transporter RarD n=1 Tax=Camelliibacillus cellulosilyticus TaxID=2174486 RepID=A0ABV9GUZ4_9BACL
MEKNNDQMLGALAAVFAYLLWGVLPIYWKLIDGVSAEAILANRIIWSFVFMIFIIFVTRNYSALIADVRELIHAPSRLVIIISASVIITINWYTFIWAVNHGHVVESSLGYYINPLVSVLLGILFLKEKLSMWQMVSFGLAVIGVLIMTIHAGTFPWISLVLALSFGVYGLLKKIVHLKAMTGLAIETLIMTPIALLYLFLFTNYSSSGYTTPGLILLIIGSGIVTAIPLLLFAAGANRISLTMVGFFQYIAPTLMLILGTLLYHEPFNHEDLIAFILIWASLILFTLSKTKGFVRMEARVIPRKSKGLAK